MTVIKSAVESNLREEATVQNRKSRWTEVIIGSLVYQITVGKAKGWSLEAATYITSIVKHRE